MIINKSMDFYERLEQSKKTLKLTNEDLGNVVGKKADAFRLATVKRSLKNYDIKELAMYLDKVENNVVETKSPPPINDEGLKDKMIALLEKSLERVEAELKRVLEENKRFNKQ
jgi:hypothetical protein